MFPLFLNDYNFLFEINVEYDNYYLLSFKLAGNELIKELVLNMGINALLIEPAALKEEIRLTLNTLNRMYREE